MNFENVITNKKLRPFFFDFISSGLALNMVHRFEVENEYRIKVQQDYFNSLKNLTNQLEQLVSQDQISIVILQGSKYYMSSLADGLLDDSISLN